MPVSGLPTKAPLLKITQGASGPASNCFQKVRKGSGAGAGTFAKARADLSSKSRVMLNAIAASNIKESTATAITHPRLRLARTGPAFSPDLSIVGVNGG